MFLKSVSEAHWDKTWFLVQNFSIELVNKQLIFCWIVNKYGQIWNFAPVCKANNYSFIVIESVAVTAILKCHGFLYGSVRFDYYSNFRLNDDKQKNSKTLITLQICVSVPPSDLLASVIAADFQ